MTQKPPIMLKTDSLTIVTPTGPLTVRRGQDNFEAVKQAIRDEDWDAAIAFCSPQRVVEQFISTTSITLEDGRLLKDGEELRGYLVNKILDAARNGFPIDHLVNFLENLQKNPSMRAREELYKFLETEDLPVTEDGHFLAYKAVNANFTDKHTGKIDNSVGTVVEMPRPDVDDNQQVGCSHGLHAGSIDYVKGFGYAGRDKFLIVKINPEDVVCIPNEDCRKLRCCRYEVAREMDGDMVHHYYSADAQPLGHEKNADVTIRKYDSFDDDDSEDDLGLTPANDGISPTTWDHEQECLVECDTCDDQCANLEDDDELDDPEPLEETKFCGSCGEVILAKWLFCTECGARQE